MTVVAADQTPAEALDALNQRGLDPIDHLTILRRLEQLALHNVAADTIVGIAKLCDPHELHTDGTPRSDNDGPPPLEQPDRPPFPHASLPAWLHNMADQLAAELQCPYDLPATIALGVLSLIANRAGVTINVAGAWQENTNLYLAAAMPPGGSKSPAFSRMTAPFAGWQDQLDEHHSDELSVWKAKHKRLADAEKTAGKEAAKGDAVAIGLHDDAFRTLDEHETARPRRERLIVSDITPEAAIDVLADNGSHMAVMSAEATFFGALTRYIERGQAANIDVYLNGYSGDDVTVDRRNRDEPVHIAGCRITICVLTQPEPLHRILGDPTNQARGLSDRFMVTEPAPTVGDRRFVGHTAHVHPQTEAEYARRIGLLIEAVTEPIHLELSDDAYEAFNYWRDDVEARRKGKWAPLGGMPEKVWQAVIRTAGLLHIASEPGDIIGTGTIYDAIALGDYWLEHALAIATTDHEDTIDRAATAVLAWAAAEGHESFTLRQLRQAGTIRHTGFNTSGEMATVLERLADTGFVTLPNGERGAGEWWESSRGRPSPPSAHDNESA